jgi:hypothetical protein
MATIPHDFANSTPSVSGWSQYFSEAERSRMLQEDASAYKAVAFVLTSALTMGLVGIVATVLWVLS